MALRSGISRARLCIDPCRTQPGLLGIKASRKMPPGAKPLRSLPQPVICLHDKMIGTPAEAEAMKALGHRETYCPPDLCAFWKLKGILLTLVVTSVSISLYSRTEFSMASDISHAAACPLDGSLTKLRPAEAPRQTPAPEGKKRRR